MTSTIDRPEFRCATCATAQMYESPRNDGFNIQIVLACEHFVRDWYPDITSDQLAEHRVQS